MFAGLISMLVCWTLLFHLEIESLVVVDETIKALFTKFLIPRLTHELGNSLDDWFDWLIQTKHFAGYLPRWLTPELKIWGIRSLGFVTNAESSLVFRISPRTCIRNLGNVVEEISRCHHLRLYNYSWQDFLIRIVCKSYTIIYRNFTHNKEVYKYLTETYTKIYRCFFVICWNISQVLFNHLPSLSIILIFK